MYMHLFLFASQPNLKPKKSLLVSGFCYAGESCHKNRLQKISLKKYRKYPVYITRSEGEPHDCKFWCTIEVGGQNFKSVHLHVHKKEAEQDAAKVAYEFLMARDGDNFADVLALIDKVMLSDILLILPFINLNYGLCRLLICLYIFSPFI